jgi:hypothetical protein
MILRSFAGFGAALALVGLVHAQEPQVLVHTAGKSRAAVRQDLYRAAQAVCSHGQSALDLRDVTCVDETYEYSLAQLNAVAARPELTAMQTRPAPAGLR